VLLRQRGPVEIACPRRDELNGNRSPSLAYDEQVDWEHHHLALAAESGVILFWLAREADHFCDRAYAQTTRFELGEAVTLHRWQQAKVVVGIDEGFSGARYLRKTIARKAPGIPLGSSLADTCDAAMKLIGPALQGREIQK
jgi:hypothetical protein